MLIKACVYRGCWGFTCGQASTLSSAVLLHFAHKRAHLHCRAVLQLQAIGLQQRDNLSQKQYFSIKKILLNME